MAANELLINTRNKKRIERPLPEETVAMREQEALRDCEVRFAVQRRQAALERLQAAALSDASLADLLLVLGLDKGA